MAFAANTSNIRADLWTVRIGAAEAPHHARVTVSPRYALDPVTTSRTGAEPVTHVNRGVMIESFEITWQQGTLDEVEVLFDTASSAPRWAKGPGESLTRHAITLRPVGDNDDANAWHFPACIYAGSRLENDGEGETQLVTTILVERDSNGRVARFGEAGP